MTVYSFTTINEPFATGTTSAYGINASGQIVGQYHDAGGDHGFLYSGATYATLNDPLGANGTYAEGINDAGQIVGYYIDGNFTQHGFLYSGGVFTTLDHPLGTKANA